MGGRNECGEGGWDRAGSTGDPRVCLFGVWAGRMPAVPGGAPPFLALGRDWLKSSALEDGPLPYERLLTHRSRLAAAEIRFRQAGGQSWRTRGQFERTLPKLLPELEQRGLDQAHYSRRELDPAEKLPEDLFEAPGCLGTPK